MKRAVHQLSRLLAAMFCVAAGHVEVVGGMPEDMGIIRKERQLPKPSAERIIVKLKTPNGVAAGTDAAIRANGLEVRREFTGIPGLKVLGSRGKVEGNRLEVLERRIAALRATGLFDYVEPDYTVTILQALPTDTAFANGDLWGLLNTGQSGGVPGIDVNASPAWSITTGSPSVVVAVIDTGIRYTHQDLVGNMWINTSEIPGNEIDDDGNGYIDDIHGINAITGSGDPMDDNNHGTHVAGTIAATAFDTGDHVGVAYNSKLMALKFLDSGGNGSLSGAIACIDYAITQGADVMNASWGSYDFSQALKDSVAAAESAGILFVAAAGNSGLSNEVSPMYPASYDLGNIISVAAIDRTGSLAYFSNYGDTAVDIGAPGVSIYSCTAATDTSYAFFNGTSMATPHVSGVVALLKSHHPTADLSELRSRLLQTTSPLVGLSGLTVTGGLVDAEAALLVSEDGDMELRASAPGGALVAVEANTVTVFVTDFLPVTGATVSGFLDGGTPTLFLDDGVAPDVQANDALYTASLDVPTAITSINLNISATASGKNPAAEVIPFPVITPPENDDFADRIILPPEGTSASGTNVQSTLEPGEPVNPSVAGTHSTWWEWVPAVSGNVTVSTAGSSFDTTLAIYQGSSLASLALIGADDDSIGFQSAVGFTASAGESYMIQVNGYGEETGSIQLNYGQFTVGPPNNDFANRILLQGGTTQTVGSNVGADVEPGEPELFLNPALESVWWEWIAPSSSPATITTFGSDFDTALGVYQGTELSTLVTIAQNDDFGGVQSSVTFTPVAGQSYKIQVYGYIDDPTGTIVLNYPDPGTPAVVNDHFAQRIVLAPGTTQTTGTNTGATLEGSEPVNPVTAGSASVWWEWTSPLSGSVNFSTAGSDFDTTLAVYTGDALATLVLVASNDNSSGSSSAVSFTATQGIAYKIQVNGSGIATGTIKLNYPAPQTPSPVNDDFGNRILLDPLTSQAEGNNAGATIEVDEPLNPATAGNRSVWWEWIAPSDSPATISTSGSDFDTTLAVYTGTSLSTLSLIAGNDDDGGPQSSVSFSPVSGDRYMIQVNGSGGATGSIVLNYPSPGYPRPINDNFARRIVLAPGTNRTSGSNDNATFETGEPLNPPAAGGQSVWWEWIAPFSGPVTIDTIDSTFDTTLAVYTGTGLGDLVLVGANDDDLSFYSSVSFESTAGVSYFIQVDGSGASSGLAYLNYPMPFPVSVSPGSIRLAGSPGASLFRDLTVVNGDAVDVGFSIASPSPWINALPASGTIPAGSSITISLVADPVPAFSTSVETTASITLNHPDLSLVEIPIEIIDESLVVEIPDTNLRRVLEKSLGRKEDEPIANVEMAILTTIDATSRNIIELTGLETAVNLFYLYLASNQITDLSPLHSLAGIFILDLSDNNLSEISVLESLPILFDVDLRLNYLDINPGSDDRAVIDSLLSRATVNFDPQKPGLLTFAGWATGIGLPPGQDSPEDLNGNLAIPNSLAFMMGLDPFTATASDLPVADRDPDTGLFTFTYYRDLKAMGLLTTIYTSTDLGIWNATTPVRINVLWEDGNGHQLVEAVFENPSDRLFFVLETNPY